MPVRAWLRLCRGVVCPRHSTNLYQAFPMNTINSKKIAIVGGGPGGLTLARLLQMRGADVQVYERDRNKDARSQSATLDLHEESGLSALREAGLWKAFQANYRPGAEKMRVMDKHANIVHDDHADASGETNRPEIDRGPLQNILLDSLAPGTVAWGRRFASPSPHNGGWKLTFQNGESALADIVIAADGGSSKLRPHLTPLKPFYAGLTVVEGSVPHSETASPQIHHLQIHHLLKGGKIFAFGDEKSLIVSAKGDGSLVFYTGVKTPEYWSRDSCLDFGDKDQVSAWFQQEYAGWDSVWQEPFDAASGSFVPRPQYCMSIDQTWDAQPNLTLLGDAAHLMPPYAGEGVNMAMQDALELSQCLTASDYPDTRSAIAAYEQQMRTRASQTAADTLESTAALHSPDAIAFMLSVLG